MSRYMKTVFDYDSQSTSYIHRKELHAGGASSIPPEMFAEKGPVLPKMAENDVVRHYTNLSRKNFGVDVGFYPLGSCTMKYNPRINESMANHPSVVSMHPLLHETRVQGLMEMLYDFEKMLAELSGFDAVTFQPAAGAHGEFTGMNIIRAYHISRGEKQRLKVVVPDSSHGTNPATAAMAGMTVKTIKSRKNGLVDLEALEKECDSTTAAFMLTNPNTLGLFEKDILKIAEIVHKCGALLYYDGANFNALMGIARPGDMNFDVMQFNLHKTFSTPHGGGGPGSGPVAVKAFLKDYLPYPVVQKTGDAFKFVKPSKSIGKVRTFYGNFGVVVRAYAYVLILGAEGLKRSSQVAVLNANYMLKKIKEFIPVPFPEYCLHEFVSSGEKFGAKDVHTLDIAKRLIDYGYHPPTIYFPLIVKEAMMFEPTETESLETLDAFIEDLKKIVQEIEKEPDLLHQAPVSASVRRVDEAKAARDLLRRE